MTYKWGTYTTDSVKIVGSCKFHLVHPDTKRLLETTFYVAMNDGSVLLSCKTTLLLGLIQPRSILDYLPPRASLITSSADHPKKMKAVLHTQKKPMATQRKQQDVTAQMPAVKEKGPKAHNKQGDDHARVPRCLSRDWQVPGTRLSYPA